MDPGLSIASSSLAAATTEIAVTSENIANAQTPGYAAERAQLAAQPGGNAGAGGGVVVTSVAQVTDALLSANNIQAQGALQNLSALQQVLTGIENVFPLGQSSAAQAASSTTSSNSSIAGQLANFWSAWDGIAQDPSGAAARTQVVDQAQGLVTSLHEASSQLSQLSTNTAASLKGQVDQVNALLGQAANLNQQIVATAGAGGSPNQLIDQLNSVTGELAASAGVSVNTQQNGSAVIYIGGVAVVQGTQAATLAVSTAGGTTAVTAANGAVAVPLTSGTMAGLLHGINSAIPQYQAALDTVASNLATSVNGQLAKGVTAANVSGSTLPLFTVNGGTTTPVSVSAATISLNPSIVADPTKIAAAAVPSTAGAQVNDGSNAGVMAELANNTALTGTSPSPDAAYQKLVEGIGSDTQSVNTQVQAQTSVANQAQQALQGVTGVNSNTELTNLMQFQASYQASAKLVSVISATMQSLLSAV